MIPAALLPPVQKPPHDPKAFLLTLNELRQGVQLKGLQLDPRSARLKLDAAKSVRRILTEPSGTFGGLAAPTNVTVTADGSIYLLDRRTITLKRFDPCDCRFQPIPCFAGDGGKARQLRNPSGIGVCQGNLFICDTGLDSAPASCGEPMAGDKVRRENHRLMVLSLRGFVLRGHWQPPLSAYEGTAPKLATKPWTPFDVDFDGEGRVYVSDPANGCIHRFSPRGVWLGCFSNLGSVTHLAIDCRDRLYARVEGKPVIKVIDLEKGTIQEIEADEAQDQNDLAPKTDGPGKVDVGSETKGNRPEDFARFFPCLPFAIDREGRLHLGGLCASQDVFKEKGRATKDEIEPGVFDLNGDPLTVPKTTGVSQFVTKGSLITGALDSELYRCVWHRLLLSGEIPKGTSIEMATFTSEVELPPSEIQAVFDQPQLTARITARETREGMEDGLVMSPSGRYLWLKLTLLGNGHASPSLGRIEIEFPRISLRRYLPAVFGEERVSADFTDRFLSLFDTTFRSIESTIDNLAGYFDPASTPAARRPGKVDFLSWLASWMGIAFDRQWPEERRRRFLKQAGKLFILRGTRKGLRLELLLYLGIEPEKICCPDDQPQVRCTPAPRNCASIVKEPCHWQPPPLILEHFRLRRWLFLGEGRLHERAVLWGKSVVNRTQLGTLQSQLGETQLIMRQDPVRDPFHVYAHQFTVYVPAKWKRSDSDRKGLENLLKAESPAHTRYNIEYVEPHFRIGFQSTLGFNTAIGRWPQGITLDETKLRHGSVLSSPPDRMGYQGFVLGHESRIGLTTELH